MINLILFGPPGSGKGTQAEHLKEHFQLLHISTGDLLRNEIANGTKLGITLFPYTTLFRSGIGRASCRERVYDHLAHVPADHSAARLVTADSFVHRLA